MRIERTDVPGERPFPLDCCLVQLPCAFPPAFDSQDPTAEVKVLWWRPPPGNTYTGQWSPWLEEDGAQSETYEKRGTLVVVNVRLWRNSNDVDKPLRRRRVQMLYESIRLIPDY